MSDSSLRKGAAQRYAPWLVGVAIGWLILVLCLRLMDSAFTSADDGYTASAAYAAGGLWHAAKGMAIFQGRFYQLFIYWVALLPFQTQSLDGINLFRVYTFLAFLAGFAYLCRNVLGWIGAACCVALFLCLYDTVGGAYNPFHGLPLWFGLGCGILCWSLGLHIKAMKRGTASQLAFALFGLSLLTYEILLLYAPLYVFLALYYLPRSNDQSASGWLSAAVWIRAIRATYAIGIYVLIYLICYVVFRHFYPGTYVGATGLTMGPWQDVLRPIIRFSVHALYWHTGETGNSVFAPLSAIYALVGLAVVAATLWISRRNDQPEEVASRSMPGLIPVLVLVAYVFLPNVLFGFTDRYRIWAGDGVRFYLGSLYSAVPWTILIYLGLRWFWNFVAEGHGGRKVIGAMVLCGLFSLTYANSHNSANFFDQSQRMSIRWRVADWVVRTIASETTQVPAQPILICGEGFTNNQELPVYFRNADMMADVDIYWSRYFSRNLARPVTYRTGIGEAGCTATLKLSYDQSIATFDDGDQKRARSLNEF